MSLRVIFLGPQVRIDEEPLPPFKTTLIAFAGFMRILTVIGARPQFIKAAAVSRAIHGEPLLEEIHIHTGQHFDSNMSQVFFDELQIPTSQHNLGIGGGTHGMNTGRMIEAIERLLLEDKPDWVLLYGDTDSTLAGALAAVKLNIPVAHVEAGLRSFNRFMPEEINRVLTDHTANLLFAPTNKAVENLRQEGISEEKIHLVGDVMYDVALFYGPMAEKQSRILDHLNLENNQYILATVHRAENTDNTDKLAQIMESLSLIAKDQTVVLPLHPRTKKKLGAFKRPVVAHWSSLIRLIDPVGYLDMVMLERKAAVIVTDSGGVQKEAFFHQVPCVTLRTETEWVELLELGWNRLAPPLESDIALAIMNAIGTKGTLKNPYGNGDAAQKIVEVLKVNKMFFT